MRLSILTGRGRYLKNCIVSGVIAVAFLMVFVPAHADVDPDEILKTVVKIRATIPSKAYTAPLLGTVREGNGIVIDSAGLILTIGYLIIEAEKVDILGFDGKTYSASVVGYDRDSGFGLLRASDPLKVEPMKLGLSSELKEDAPVLIVGFGGQNAVIGAKVLSRREYVAYWEYILDSAIFTAPPHPNYGGAALIDRNGALVGVGSLSTVLRFPGLGSIPANMFVPIDLLKPILNRMISQERASDQQRPWLGIFVEETYGRVFVIRVSPAGPADRAGLQSGDIILKVENNVVSSRGDFYRKVWATGNAGVEVPLSVLQGAEIKTVTVPSSDFNTYLELNREN